MTKQFPLVAAIILNWNHPEDTLACLAAVSALDYPALLTLVVDNGSTDDSVEHIRAACPNVEIVETGANLGYTGGNNVGIRRALAHGAAYVWLLNDDTIAAPNSLSALVRAAESEPGAGFTGPLVRIRERPDLILSAGGVLGPDMRPSQRGLGELDEGQYNEIAEADFLSGCALLVNRSAIKRIGLLDEAFFAYGEDVEWCFRGSRAGFKVLFVPQAVVWHPDTRQRDENSARVMYYVARNHLLFLRKRRLGARKIARALLRNAILIANWSLNPKWRHARPKRNALWLAVRDFALGRTGQSRHL